MRILLTLSPSASEMQVIATPKDHLINYTLWCSFSHVVYSSLRYLIEVLLSNILECVA